MARICCLAALIAVLWGCTSAPTSRVVVQRVDVPVPVQRTVPANLLDCVSGAPLPVFQPSDEGVVLPVAQIPVFQSLIALLFGCNAAWRIWATAAPAE